MGDVEHLLIDSIEQFIRDKVPSAMDETSVSIGSRQRRNITNDVNLKKIDYRL